MSISAGSGLPDSARARLERARASGVTSSLLSVNGQVGLEACGFFPVGEVMGCVAFQIGFAGYGGCGWVYGMMAPPTRTALSRYGGGGWGGFKPYIDAIDGAWSTVFDRLTAEAAALGADGVVDIRLQEHSVDEGVTEYVALGTAVRSHGATHASGRPFTTTLSGPDLAKLLHAGYMAVEAIVAISVGVRHDDYSTRAATMFGAGNIEVPGYTDLVQAVKGDARDELRRRIAARGAAGAIVTAPLLVDVHELEVAEGHRDHMAYARLVATSIVAFGARPDRPRPIAVLPLSQFKERR